MNDFEHQKLVTGLDKLTMEGLSSGIQISRQRLRKDRMR